MLKFPISYSGKFVLLLYFEDMIFLLLSMDILLRTEQSQALGQSWVEIPLETNKYFLTYLY